MKTIKKQFKDFWQYFRLVQRGAGTSEAGKRIRKYIPALIVIIFAFIIPLSQMGLNFSVFEGVIIGSAMGVGITTAIKPSALQIAPFSPKQRMIFTFLSTLLMALIAVLFIFAVEMVILSLIAFIAFCVDGSNMFASFLPTEPIHAYGHAFSVLAFTLIFFATYAIFHFERKRNVTIAAVIFLVLMEVFTLVMTNLCGNAAPWESSAVSYRFYMYASVPHFIIHLSLPWVPILVLGILNALAIAASVYLTVRRFRSDKV